MNPATFAADLILKLRNAFSHAEAVDHITAAVASVTKALQEQIAAKDAEIADLKAKLAHYESAAAAVIK